MADAAPNTRSALAIASFVLGLLSCACLPAPLALVLGIIALVQIGKNPSPRGRNFAIAGIALSVVLGLIALLAALALPSFLTFGARAKQSECKSNLKAFFTTQRMSFEDVKHYTADFSGMDFKPERGARYAYVTAALPISAEAGRTVLMPDKGTVTWDQVRAALSTTSLAGGVHPGVEGTCPDGCFFTMICIANLDDDDALDVWSISSKPRTAPDGSAIDPGTPYCERDDTRD